MRATGIAGVVAAVAVVAGAARAQEQCRLVVLNGSAAGALDLQGSVSVRVRDAAAVNSIDAAAVRGSGLGVLQVPELILCGGVDFVGGRTLNGTLVERDAPAPDPLAWLKIPSGGEGPAAGGPLLISGGSWTLSPGEFASGVRIEGAAVTLNPGVYIFGGAGLSLASGSVSGEGVTLVMNHGSLVLNGKAALSAPESGDLEGVVICQARGNASPMGIAGGSGTVLWGAVYAPAAAVSLAGVADGGAGPLMGRMLVADRVKVDGSGWVRIGEP
jgi:hypothetical protein